MPFKYLSQKIYLFYIRSKEPNIFFPAEHENHEAKYFLAGLIILLVIGIVACLIRYLRERHGVKAYDEGTECFFRKDNKRSFYRIKDSIDAKFLLGYKDLCCAVCDISEGGVGFYTDLGPDRLKPSTVIKRLVFTLPDGNNIKANAVVTRIVPLKDKRLKGFYLCGVEFVYISDSCREMIVKYIHSKQRETLRKIKEEDIKNEN